MKKFLAVAAAIGFLVAGKPALAAQGFVYQGLVANTAFPADKIAATAAMQNGHLAVVYSGNVRTTLPHLVEYDNGGNQIKTFTLANDLYVYAMASDSNGRFIVIGGNVNEDSIDIYDANGNLVTSQPSTVNDLPMGITIGVGNSIIINGYEPGPTCNSKMQVFDSKLNLLSTFAPTNRCVTSVAALGSNLLIGSRSRTGAPYNVIITDYNGKTLSGFGTGIASQFGPITTTPDQTRVFFQLKNDAGDAGIGVFNPSGKLLQFLPYPYPAIETNYAGYLPVASIAGLASTNADYLYVFDTFRFSPQPQVQLLQRFGQGTLPPAPIARPTSATVQAGKTVTINVAKYVTHGPLDYLAVSKAPAQGKETVPSLGTIQYTANGTAKGTDSFAYTAWNSTGTSTATVTVKITPAVPVTGSPQTVTTTENTAVTVNVTAGAQHAPFTSVAVATQPAHGKAVVNKLNIVYTPTAGFTGQDSFTYTVSNTGGASAPGTVTVLVGN